MKNVISLLITTIALSCTAQDIAKEYFRLVDQIRAKRDFFKNAYSESDSIRKEMIILEAREYLVSTMGKELFPFWYGTSWDFNGTTRVPQKGRIACGYFVTNTLTDVGFNIPRIKWAQSASEVFIKKLCSETIKRFSYTPIKDVEAYLIEAGSGLYLVGLDMHTGYIFVDGEDVRFVHADYYEAEIGVVSEELDSNSPIKDSSYRVIGKLMSDEMILAWIFNRTIG